jgi:hypothetical protein
MFEVNEREISLAKLAQQLKRAFRKFLIQLTSCKKGPISIALL